jgi:NADH dehydrogenase
MEDLMAEPGIHMVTGAYGYSGQYITDRLLARGLKVKTLTNSPDRRNRFGDRVPPVPYNFHEPQKLVESLRGVEVLYNTYWVRFNYREKFRHDVAVRNTITLFHAAKDAGVKRIVHTSITNPSLESPLNYFSGKARLEEALKETGISHAILRPAVFFGGEDILINNIAWFLRNFPVFGMFGRGQYRLQPIHVEDFADLAVEQGMGHSDVTIDAIGPETFTYRDLVEQLSEILEVRRLILPMPPSVAWITGKIIGFIVGDVITTRDEIDGLMADLLYTESPPAGTTRLTEWARQHREEMGRSYSSELARRKDLKKSYADLKSRT